MKIFVTGTRGVPNIPGGVESHCQNLYPLIVKQGHQVKLSRRSSYAPNTIYEWSDIQLVDIFCPRKKSIEAIVHTLLSIIEAKKWGADIIHIHAIGPALMVPFARLLGLKVVMTNHGPDYDREKWGGFAKLILRLGEKLGGTFSNEVIVISNVIKSIVEDRCGRECHLIPNGVTAPEKSLSTSYLESLNINPRGYILAVARFVPEKGLIDLLKAYENSDLSCQLVIAGDSDHEDSYSREIKSIAAKNDNVILTGYISGDPLHEVFSHANLFVLPSYHEGLPIALLEALSYGIKPLVSNIPANLEVLLDDECYFQCRDIDDLTKRLKTSWTISPNTEWAVKSVDTVRKKYNWHNISEETVRVYKKALASE